MTKVRKLISLCLSATMISAGAVVPANAATGDAVSALSKDGVAFRFALIGDSHVNADGQHKGYFEKAVQTLNTVGGIDAFGLNGDVILYSSAVTEAPYDHINEVLSANGVGNSEGSIPYIYAMGNHEFIQNDNKTETCAQAVEMFKTKMGQELNCHKEFNGYHVIASGGESYNCQWSAGNYNTDEEWIENEILKIEAEDDDNPNKPIFLMLHHPIIDSTLRGVTSIDRRYTKDFVNFLAARPNIVQLTAHQHIAAQYPQTICQDLGFTSFQTPLTSTASGNNAHQTSFIDVTTDNKVKIYKIDLETQKYIGEPWVIDIAAGKDGFKYTDAIRANNTQAPAFADDAQITATNVEHYSVTLNYPTGTIQAMNDQQDNIVRAHKVTITDKETGEVVKTESYNANFTTVPQPETLSRNITNLDAGTTYTVTVQPMSMFGVYGEALTGEFTTAGEKSEIEVSDPVALTFDKSLIGDVTDGTPSYDKLESTSVLIRKGDYFTYTFEVGEGQQIEEGGMYRLSHRYASVSDATLSVAVKQAGEADYKTMASAVSLPATGDYATYKTQTEADYIYLKEGTNVIKFTLTDISKYNDGIYVRPPALSKVISGAYVDCGINTSVYNAITQTNGTGTGSITSNISTKTYQTTSMMTFRKGNYVVLPVTVPYTAAYKAELTAKSTKSISSNVFKAAYSTESLDAAKALTTYSSSTASLALTTSWNTFTLSDSIVLEGGKTYYFKIAATAVGSSHISQLSNIRFTDNGEYSTNADLSALTVSEGEFTSEFDSDVTEYTVYSSMPSSEKVTITATPAVTGVSIAGAGEVAVNYGINEIPVTVTSRNGKVKKTYNITYVVADTHASLGIADADMYVGTSTTPINVARLFNGTGVVKNNGSGDAGFGVAYGSTAYIQIDLKEKYDLYEFTWEKTNQGDSVKGIQIWGSNDPTFAQGSYVVLGTTDGTAKVGTYSSHKIMTTLLNGTGKYQYVRIVKPSGAGCTFYPVKMDIYGVPEVTSTVDGLATTITVPSSYYAVGEQVIAAAYNAAGRLVDADVKSAANAYETTLSLTKQNADDEVKVMVWNDFVNMIPRWGVITPTVK